MALFCYKIVSEKFKYMYSYSARRTLSNHIINKRKKIVLEFCIVCTLSLTKDSEKKTRTIKINLNILYFVLVKRSGYSRFSNIF